jgi:hypothetical protein
VQLRDGSVKGAPPSRSQSLEEVSLFVTAAKRIMRLSTLNLLQLEAHFLEQLPKVSHGGAPLGGQPLALLAMDRKSLFERRSDAQAVKIDQA